jgi:hypothetical protein
MKLTAKGDSGKERLIASTSMPLGGWLAVA